MAERDDENGPQAENEGTSNAGTDTNPGKKWTFLTHHSHVLLCLAKDPDMRVRDIADNVGLTERAVVNIIGELVDAGIVERERHGRRNHYCVNLAYPLRHHLKSGFTVGDLLAVFLMDFMNSGGGFPFV